MTPDERMEATIRRKEIMSDPDSRAAHDALAAHFSEQKKKREKMLKLRSFLIAKRGLPVTV